jgi:putative ABC transport system permease protein
MAAAGRGLVPALGLRRAERQSGMGQLPLIVLLLTVAIGTFSSTMLATIDRGQVVGSWLSVGAAYRITANDTLGDLDVSGVDGVEAVAAAHFGEVSVGLAGTGEIGLVALDAPEYMAVTRGTPAETTLPSSFLEAPVEGDDRIGTEANPIPAIVSRDLVRTSTTRVAIGDVLGLTIRARFANFRVVEVRETLPGAAAGRSGIVVPRAIIAAAISDRPFDATTLYVRAPAGTRAALEEAAADVVGGVRITSQDEQLTGLRERPLVEAVRIGFFLALAAAVAYAAMAVIVSLLLAGMARARETAHLRTLGIGRAQVALLAVIEHAPPVVVALVAGLLLGVGVGWVVLPGLQLGAFTGSASDPALNVNIGQLVVLTGALLVIVAIGVALAAWAQRRADPASAIRSGIE